MKNFALDEKGDLAIGNNRVIMKYDDSLLKQRVAETLGTNKGEWPFNPEKGINFRNILGKNVTDDDVLGEITQGLLQVDETFILSDFSVSRKARDMSVRFVAINSAGQRVEVNHAIN